MIYQQFPSGFVHFSWVLHKLLTGVKNKSIIFNFAHQYDLVIPQQFSKFPALQIYLTPTQSYLMQIICTQLYGFKYSYLIQIICTQLYGFKYSYVIQIMFTQLCSFKYSYPMQINYTQLYGFKYSYLIQIIGT